MVFVTKRDTNGNRYYLTVNLTEKTFSRVPRWYNSEYITVTKKDKNKIMDQLTAAGFIERDI